MDAPPTPGCHVPFCPLVGTQTHQRMEPMENFMVTGCPETQELPGWGAGLRQAVPVPGSENVGVEENAIDTEFPVRL